MKPYKEPQGANVKPQVSKGQLLPALSELDPFVNSTGIGIQTVQVTTDIPLWGP